MPADRIKLRSGRRLREMPAMPKEKTLRLSISILMSFLLIFALISLFPGSSFAALGKDYVIVIDVSTSMQDIFDEVKQVSKDTVGRAEIGDNVAIITFGEQARLLERKQIRQRADVEGLLDTLDDLYPTDYATYLNRGLERGLYELRYLFEKYPDRERVLLWLSDDKDNPPDELGQEFLTLDSLREESTTFDPGAEWFEYDAPLSEVKNDNMVDFVTWARRTTFRVAVKEQTVDLGSFDNGSVNKTVLLTFEPRHPGAAGLEFLAGARLINPKDPTRMVPVNLSPQRVVASGHLWQQEFNVTFKGEPGEYNGSLSFQPVAGSSLDVNPRTVAFTAMIAPPKLAPDTPPEAVKPKPEGLLASAKESGIIATEDRPPGLTRPDKPLGFGPLDPGKKDSKIITLFLNKETDPEGITHDLSLELPEGVSVESKVFGKGTRLAAEITIKVDADVRLPEQYALQEAYEGSIRFKSAETGVEVLPVYMPIRVAFNTDRVRWGRKMLPGQDVGQIKARGMTFEELSEELEKKEKGEKDRGPVAAAFQSFYSKFRQRYVFIPVMAAIVLVIFLLLYRLRPARELFIGELIVIKDPTGSDMKNVNLKRIGSLHDKDALIIGSGPKADVRLNHESVSATHCKITTKTSEDQTQIILHPVKGAPVKINDIEQPEKLTLSDKDLIGVGDFILLFSNPEAQREVVVHFLDGHTMRGTPVTWDISMPSFELLQGDSEDTEETSEDIKIVDFKDLKAVFFVQAASGGRPGIPSERVNKEDLIEVTFADGEKIEGHPLNDYSDVAERFYLLPREMPNIISILVDRGSVKEVERRRAPSETQAAKGGGFLGLFRKGKGESVTE